MNEIGYTPMTQLAEAVSCQEKNSGLICVCGLTVHHTPCPGSTLLQRGLLSSHIAITNVLRTGPSCLFYQ